MDEREFKRRAKQLALDVIAMVEQLPARPSGRVLGQQLLRSATSVGANYRAACRGRSPAEILAKLSIVEEEADETMYWLELLVEARLVVPATAAPLLDEANQIVAMTVTSKRTLKERTAKEEWGQGPVANRKSQIVNPSS